MGDTLSFTAFQVGQVPKYIEEILKKFAEIKEVFGIKCYVWLRNDYKDPAYKLDENDEETLIDWLVNSGVDKDSEACFEYHFM